MARPSNTKEKREEICLALTRVMARTGYDGATVSAIAAEAGVASGGVHYHFASKGEILIELVNRLVGSAETRIQMRTSQAAGAREELFAILDGLLDTQDDSDSAAVAVWALIGAEAVRNQDVRRVYGSWIARARERLRKAFTEACRAEGRSAQGATRAAAALIALVEGYYTIAAGAPSVIPPGSAAPSSRQIAAALLEQQPRRAS